jgi:hypothetical protein
MINKEHPMEKRRKALKIFGRVAEQLDGGGWMIKGKIAVEVTDEQLASAKFPLQTPTSKNITTVLYSMNISK